MKQSIGRYHIIMKHINKIIFILVIFTFVLFPANTVKADEPKLDANFALNANCKLSDKETITLFATFPYIPACDDNTLYVYALYPFMYDITENAELVCQIPANTSAICSFPLRENNQNMRLYQKYAVGVKINGIINMITYPQYITNPELLASNTRPRKNRKLKSVQGTDFWNVEVSKFDFFEDTVTTIQLMNSNSDGIYTNPLARTSARLNDSHPASEHFYYMPNAADEEGVKNLAESCVRYAYVPNVENYILGNEVNVRKWNYMSFTSWEEYIREYVQAFRVTYNAIKSVNANAHVFTCVDLSWDRNLQMYHPEYYEFIDAKDFLITFNNMIMQEGNIDWSLSQHPYPAPLDCSLFWNDTVGRDVPYCHDLVRADKILTFENLSVLTDFLQNPKMLSPTGNVRHLILSEIGLTNEQGDEVQAAAICASYIAAEQNPYVEEITYLLADCGPGIDTRLSGKSQEMFDNMDEVNAGEYREWAKKYIGIHDWSQVLR